MNNEIWIDNEFEKWRKMPLYNPFGLDDKDEWIPKSFALYILKKVEEQLLKTPKTKKTTEDKPQNI